jgi:type I site-specific restriction endonuclease
MPDLAPEQRARQHIDAMLIASGWVVQNYKSVDFSVGRGIALREVPLKTGPCDYLLLVDRKAVGVVEAKKEGIRREVFGKSNDFCKKITYQAKHPVTGDSPKPLIAQFRESAGR